jgi:uncharacterized protein
MRKVLAAIACWGLAACAASPDANVNREPDRVLVFTHTTGFRHASIEAGADAVRRLGAELGAEVTVSADPDVFSAEGLAGVDVIVLMSTTSKRGQADSEWFVGPRRAALQAFVRGGGGVLGVHGASDSHRGWPWYTQMLGGSFARHPRGTPEGALTVVAADHPATEGLPAAIVRRDEWYYMDDFDPTVRVLVTLDPASIGESDVNPNPISWAKPFEGGRVFYTAMGHTSESFSDPYVTAHLRGALLWLLRR